MAAAGRKEAVAISISGEIQITLHRAAALSEGLVNTLSSAIVLVRNDLGSGNAVVLADREMPRANGKPKLYASERAIDPAEVISLNEEAVALLLQALGVLGE